MIDRVEIALAKRSEENAAAAEPQQLSRCAGGGPGRSFTAQGELRGLWSAPGCDWVTARCRCVRYPGQPGRLRSGARHGRSVWRHIGQQVVLMFEGGRLRAGRS